jgi:hypothetical protein
VYVSKREKRKCNEKMKERKVEGNNMKKKGSKEVTREEIK